MWLEENTTQDATTLAESFARDGYAIVPEVISPEVVADLVAALDANDSDPTALRRGGSVYGLRDLLRCVPGVRRLAVSRPIRSIVEPILGVGAFAVRATLFDKTPSANWNLPWHRDLTIAVRRRVDVPGFGPWTIKAGVPHVQPPSRVLDRMLAVRVHLDDAGPGNGPLHVLPGSHAVADESLSDWRRDVAAVSCAVRRGDVVLMRPRLLHASSSCDSPAHRRVIHIEFAADPLPDGLQWLEEVRSEREH